ncbi:MAG: MFS transporter, partial [Turicibacter sp.]
MNILRKNKTTVAMIVFLLGIFMGAMDTGIVSPARTVIANGLNLDSTLSVWMVTIYSLAYAVSMPITSKLSDRFGRKKVYMICVTIFAFGSLLCGLANYVESYNFLLTSRVIQAIGGGGILPIATAYIGASFPQEKRGSALGLVGAIFGIATLIGPTIGTFILSVAGNAHWGYLFFINLPISIIILLLASTLDENKPDRKNKKMDLLGSLLLGIIILSLMYALTNLQFYNFFESFKSFDVWPYLLVFIIFLPIFILVEKKADDPVLNLKFFTSSQTALTLLISFIVGCGLMGTVFLPQFAENVLKIKIGTGGYIVTLFALVTGFSAPLGGNLIDRIGVKKILLIGFSSTIIGTLYQALVTASHPSFTHLFIGLIFMGIGMGLTMGTPVNYLMMSLVDPNEISMGQATVSLVRSIGVAISPNILVNFIAEAGKKVPTELQNALPKLTGMPTNSFNL